MKDGNIDSNKCNIQVLDLAARVQQISTEEKEVKAGRLKLESWLNKNMKIEMSDGRILIGVMVCTDSHKNVILGSCVEYLHYNDGVSEEEPRMLGLAMVPGNHIKSICIDETEMTPQHNTSDHIL